MEFGANLRKLLLGALLLLPFCFCREQGKWNFISYVILIYAENATKYSSNIYL